MGGGSGSGLDGWDASGLDGLGEGGSTKIVRGERSCSEIAASGAICRFAHLNPHELVVDPFAQPSETEIDAG